MSRWYGMHVEVSGYAEDKIDEICEALNKEWPFDAEVGRGSPKKIWGSGESNLCGGESEEQFAERVAIATWKANGAYCLVEVTATYMEELPCEFHCLNEDDYEELMAIHEEEENDDG